MKLGPAGKLIEKGWTQNAYARDEKGNKVPHRSPDATCWCTYGAINRAYQHPDAYHRAVSLLTPHIGTPYLMKWNDDRHRTKEEVLEAFRKAGI